MAVNRSIQEIVAAIRTAIFGKDVRTAIADGIEKCYEDTAKPNEIKNIETVINEFEGIYYIKFTTPAGTATSSNNTRIPIDIKNESRNYCIITHTSGNNATREIRTWGITDSQQRVFFTGNCEDTYRGQLIPSFDTTGIGVYIDNRNGINDIETELFLYREGYPYNKELHNIAAYISSNGSIDAPDNTDDNAYTTITNSIVIICNGKLIVLDADTIVSRMVSDGCTAEKVGSTGFKFIIRTGRNLIYNLNNGLVTLSDYQAVRPGDVILLTRTYNGFVNGLLLPKVIDNKINGIKLYGSSPYSIYCENNTFDIIYTSDNIKLYVNHIIVRLGFNADIYAIDNYGLDNEYIETINSKNYMVIPNWSMLVYSNGSVRIIPRSEYDPKKELLLISVCNSFINQGILFESMIDSKLRLAQSSDHFLTDGSIAPVANTLDKIAAYNASLINSTDNETFVFFTDPHTVNEYVSDSNMRLGMNLIEYAFNSTPTSYVICGGDWLQDNDTKAVALNRLGYIDGFMRRKYGDAYLPIIGNHDTNYQGIDHEGSDENTGRLPQDVIRQVWFRKYGSMYYSYKALSSRFYIFDTELDWYTSMTEYRWEQVDWFAKQLIQNDDTHSIMFFHIFSNASKVNLEANVPGNVVPFIENLYEVAMKYNAKETLTLNGESYNFTGTSGKIAFAQCGHSHFDSIVTYKGIPTVITTNTTWLSNFDLCVVDYTNEKYKMFRIGDGDDREVNIIT